MSGYSYKDLDVWKRSIALVTDIYTLTKEFPKEELYALTNQIRRAAISVPSNIAEGRAKCSARDYIHFINIARGSIAELETQLIISANLGYTSQNSLNPLFAQIDEIGKMLHGLRSSIEKKLTKCGG